MKKRKILFWIVLALLLCCNMQVFANEVPEKETQEHVYAEPEFKWYSSGGCSVEVKCISCEVTHSDIYEPYVSSVYEAPTCTEDGKTTYKVEFELDGKVYTDQSVVTHKKLGHKFDDTECVRCDAVRNPASVVKMPAERVVTYSGNLYVIKVQEVKGSTGKITYKYYAKS